MQVQVFAVQTSVIERGYWCAVWERSGEALGLGKELGLDELGILEKMELKAAPRTSYTLMQGILISNHTVYILSLCASCHEAVW